MVDFTVGNLSLRLRVLSHNVLSLSVRLCFSVTQARLRRLILSHSSCFHCIVGKTLARILMALLCLSLTGKQFSRFGERDVPGLPQTCISAKAGAHGNVSISDRCACSSSHFQPTSKMSHCLRETTWLHGSACTAFGQIFFGAWPHPPEETLLLAWLELASNSSKFFREFHARSLKYRALGLECFRSTCP